MHFRKTKVQILENLTNVIFLNKFYIIEGVNNEHFCLC
jgi:hypothetical protein